MIDLALCHWVVDDRNRLYLASAPSLRAPFCFDCFVYAASPARRLTAEEAELITQAAIEVGMRPMTFVSSEAGIAFLQSLFPVMESQSSRVA